jgi:hypothetical protein
MFLEFFFIPFELAATGGQSQACRLRELYIRQTTQGGLVQTELAWAIVSQYIQHAQAVFVWQGAIHAIELVADQMAVLILPVYPCQGRISLLVS